MARGKQTCRILKEVRRQIAAANDIEFITSECRYRGDCPGTCPKCEAEVRYLEQQLRTRQLTGKALAITGISAGMILISGCSGTASDSRTDDILLGSVIENYEETEETDTVEEGEVTIADDSIPCTPSDLDVIKNGEIADDDYIIITQGEVPAEPPADPDENIIYPCVEQQPQFPGGPAEMLRFIGQHIRYPQEQLDEGFQGRVVVKFYVDTLGHVCEPTIVRGKGSALDKEALRVVRLLPDFIPGEMNGQKVNVWMTIPIVFRLPEE